jgi:hypothetical protein
MANPAKGALMDERFMKREVGVQAPSQQPFSVQPPRTQTPSIPAEQEQNRELVWFLLWAAWGALSGFAFREDSDPRKIIIPTIFGGLMGIIGGCHGEKLVGKRAGRKLVFFWATYWSVFWTAVMFVPDLYMWAIVWSHGEKVEGVSATIILNGILGVGIGATGGTLGGMIRARKKKRQSSPPDT